MPPVARPGLAIGGRGNQGRLSAPPDGLVEVGGGPVGMPSQVRQRGPCRVQGPVIRGDFDRPVQVPPPFVVPLGRLVVCGGSPQPVGQVAG